MQVLSYRTPVSTYRDTGISRLICASTAGCRPTTASADCDEEKNGVGVASPRNRFRYDSLTMPI
jgi:hypothetical protein